MHFTLYAPLHHLPQPQLQEVEIQSFFQIPGIQIIGLPSQEIQEAKERIRAAILASGFEVPRRRVVLNLSPAGVRKQGTDSDLALALAILSHHPGAAPTPPGGADSAPRKIVATGELALDGTLRPVGRAVRALTAATAAQAEVLMLHPDDLTHLESLFPSDARFDGLNKLRPRRIAVRNLSEALAQLTTLGTQPHGVAPFAEGPAQGAIPSKADAAPQAPLPLHPAIAKTLGISTAGRHHLLIFGPKGVGKSQSLNWMRAHFQTHTRPPLESYWIGELSDPWFSPGSLWRSVSPSVRPAGLWGSISHHRLTPGEFALAHGGVLFGDEFLEWPRDSIEALRIPLEERTYQLQRSGRSVRFPAQFQWIATANLCPCGRASLSSDSDRHPESARTRERCSCKPTERARYFGRISGAILERIDLIFRLSPTSAASRTQTFLNWQTHVLETQGRLVRAYGKPPGELSAIELESILTQQPELREGLDASRGANHASLRARHKSLRVALTLAAWDGQLLPQQAHWSEARHFRGDWLYDVS